MKACCQPVLISKLITTQQQTVFSILLQLVFGCGYTLYTMPPPPPFLFCLWKTFLTVYAIFPFCTKLTCTLPIQGQPVVLNWFPGTQLWLHLATERLQSRDELELVPNLCSDWIQKGFNCHIDIDLIFRSIMSQAFPVPLWMCNCGKWNALAPAPAQSWPVLCPFRSNQLYIINFYAFYHCLIQQHG